MEKEQFKLGQRVWITKIYHRINGPWSKTHHGWEKKWRSCETQPREGTLVGIRTLQDGYVIPHGDNHAWEPTNYKKAYIVATSLHRRAVFVPPYAIFEIDNKPPT